VLVSLKTNNKTNGKVIIRSLLSHYATKVSLTKYTFKFFFILVLSEGPLTKKYKFEQFHFHWGGGDLEGSEHRVDGKMYPAEVGSKQ